MSVVDKTTQRADELRSQITRVEAELAKLKEQLAKLGAGPGEGPATKPDSTPPSDWKWPLSQAEYDRYGRQLLIPSVGVQGMEDRNPPQGDCWLTLTYMTQGRSDSDGRPPSSSVPAGWAARRLPTLRVRGLVESVSATVTWSRRQTYTDRSDMLRSAWGGPRLRAWLSF